MPYDFDLTVIGGGAAGIVAARASAGIGARTALVESSRLGGDCTWTGCIPSKALLKSARVAQTIRIASQFGIAPTEQEVDGAAVFRRIHDIREYIHREHDQVEKYGVRMFPARARFTGPHAIELSTGQRITSRYFV